MDRRLWELVPVAGGALFFAYRTYADYVNRLEEDHHRHEVIEFLEHGMSVLDRDGRVTLWNDALERMLGCSRDRALGQALDLAVPALGRTELPKAIKDTLADGKRRVMADIGIPSAGGLRTLQVKVLPVADGVTLLWHDVTERMHAEDELKQHGRAAGARGRRGQRRAVAVEPADAGVLRLRPLARDDRAAAATPRSGRPDEWLDRVHPDDVARPQGGARSSPRGPHRRLPARAPHPPSRTAPIAGSSAAASRCAGSGPAAIGSPAR